jgi:hypothetical protein
LCLDYATNAAVIDSLGDEVAAAAAVRLESIFALDDRELLEIASNPELAYLRGLRDPVMPFLKSEPHPLRKIREGRYRMICGVSLIDQLVERLLLSPFVGRLKLAYPRGALLSGIGFDKDHVQPLGEEVDRLCAETSCPVVSTDAVGWDGLIENWLFGDAVELIASRCTNPSRNLETGLLFWCATCIAPIYVVELTCGDGRVVLCALLKAKAKHMPSGSYWTTPVNGVMRLLVAFYAAVEAAKTAGDDNLSWTQLSSGALARASELKGFPLRDVTVHPDGKFEFCSHTFSRNAEGEWSCYLNEGNVQKALYKALTARAVNPEGVLSVRNELLDAPPRLLAAFDEVVAHYKLDTVDLPQGGGQKNLLTYVPQSRTMPKAKPVKAVAAAKKKRSAAKPKPSSPAPNSAKAQATAKLAHQVCALTDPFCTHAEGAKWPSESSGPTVTYSATRRGYLSSGTQGWGYVLFCPSQWSTFTLQTYAATTDFPVVAAPSAELTAELTAVVGNSESVRLVSAGITVWDVAAATANGGSLISSCFAGTAPVGTTYSNGTPTGTDRYYGDRRAGMSWTSRPVKSTSRNFQDCATSYVAQEDWQSILIQANGTASSILCEFQVICHYEITLKPITGIPSTIATKAPSTKGERLAADLAVRLQDAASPVVKGGTEMMARYIEGKAKALVVGAATSFFGAGAGAIASTMFA